MITENLTEMRTLNLCVKLNALKRELYMSKGRSGESYLASLKTRIEIYETEIDKRNGA